MDKLDALKRPAQAPRFDATFRETLHELLRWRRDVRRFTRAPLPHDSIERLIAIACLAPSVGLSEPWRFVLVEDEARRAAIRQCFEDCNREALQMQAPERASLYARLKLAGLDDAPCHLAVFADHATAQGGGLGRLTMDQTLDYSVAIAVHTLWLDPRSCARRRNSRRAAGLAFYRLSLRGPSGSRGRHACSRARRLGTETPVF